MYPEWIQEQLDKLGVVETATKLHPADRVLLELKQIAVQLRRIEARQTQIDGKIERLLAFCESE